MYRPVHSRRRERAEHVFERAGYDPEVSGIEPEGYEQEGARPNIAPKPLPKPIKAR